MIRNHGQVTVLFLEARRAKWTILRVFNLNPKNIIPAFDPKVSFPLISCAFWKLMFRILVSPWPQVNRNKKMGTRKRRMMCITVILGNTFLYCCWNYWKAVISWRQFFLIHACLACSSSSRCVLIKVDPIVEMTGQHGAIADSANQMTWRRLLTEV